MKKLAALIALILFLTLTMVLPANRSSARQSEPTLDQVLEKYVQAVGGKTAFDKLTSRVTLQDVTGGDATQTVEIYEKAPNKRLIMVSSGGSVQTLNGFDGAIAWVKNQGVVREMQDIQRDLFKHNAEFNREIRLKELYPQLKFKGNASVEGRAAYLVELPVAQDRVEQMYFDAKTGLLIRRVQQAIAMIRQSDDEIPEMKIVDIQNDYDDYRDVDGVKLPFMITRRSPMFSTTVKVKEIKHNVVIDDSKFRKPSS